LSRDVELDLAAAWTVAKLALPITRLSIMRPAMDTSPGWLPAWPGPFRHTARAARRPGASAEIVGEGHALLAQGLQFLAALGDDLVLIYGKPFGGGRGGGRGSVRS
jgi:hypothetical protein